MHKLGKYFLTIIVLLLSTLAYADDNYPLLQGYKFPWTLGVDVTYMWITPVNDFAQITYKNRKGCNLYAAYRTRSPWSFEGGYNFTNNPSRRVNVEAGDVLFGATATGKNSYQIKIRLKGYYFDVYGNYKLLQQYNILQQYKYLQKSEAKFGVGIGFVRRNIRFYPVHKAVGPIEHTLAALHGSHTGANTARFNCGLQTLIGKQLGLRALFSFETTSTIKAEDVVIGVNPRMFTNSYSVFLGVYYNVTGYYD